MGNPNQLTVLMDFISTDPLSKGSRFNSGLNVSPSLFSKDYLETLINNGYIKKDKKEDVMVIPTMEKLNVSSTKEEVSSDHVEIFGNIEPLVAIEKQTETIQKPDFVRHDQSTMKNLIKPVPELVNDDIVHIDVKLPQNFEEKIIGPILITIISLFGALISGYMTVTGYSSMFATTSIIVILVISTLEVAKFSIASMVLHQKGLDIVHKIILGFFAVTLTLLASVGHYGFLTKLASNSSSIVSTSKDSMSHVDSELISLKSDKTILQKQFDSIPDSYVTAKARMYKQVKDKIDKIDSRMLVLNTEKSNLINNSSEVEDHNIMGNVASLMKVDKSTFTSWVIAVLSLVIDPLIIVMASASSKMRRQRV